MKKSNTKEFIRKGNKEHNVKYTYLKTVYKNCYEKVIITCPKHGDFLQQPNNHLSGMGCDECGKILRSEKKRDNTKNFIKKSKIIHPNKYNYSKTVYGKNNHEYVVIICPDHGEFLQNPNCHLNGRGCPICANNIKSNTDDFIKKSNHIHKEIYDYSLVDYKNRSSQVTIICKNHGPFNQIAYNHLNGEGCKKCKTSKGENKISEFLIKNNIVYNSEKSFDGCKNPKTNYKLRFDFYIQSKNLLIEYDGPQHFKIGQKLGGYINNISDLESIQHRDKIKTQYAKKNGIRLLRIKYTKLNRIDEILKEELKA